MTDLVCGKFEPHISEATFDATGRYLDRLTKVNEEVFLFMRGEVNLCAVNLTILLRDHHLRR